MSLDRKANNGMQYQYECLFLSSKETGHGETSKVHTVAKNHSLIETAYLDFINQM